MDTTSSEYAGRGFWEARAGLLAQALESTRGALPFGAAREPHRVRRAVPGPTVAQLAKVTGEEPVLMWTAVAAATALVLRRLGAGDLCALQTAAPLPGGLPVVARTGAGHTFRELLGQLRGAVGEACAHVGSLDAVPADLRADPALVRIGHTGDSGPERPGLSVTIGEGWIEASGDTVGAGLLEVIADSVVEVLGRGLRDPQRRITDIGILDERARETVLTTFNETRDIRGGTPFRELLLRAAAARPGDVAVHDAAEEITYAELVRCATAIGARLRGLGAGPDTVVALSAPRDARFVVAAVGVLFSGAAYLPVERSLPADRRARMLEGAFAVISTDGSRLPEDTGPAYRLDLDELIGAARSSTVLPTERNVAELLGPAPDPHDLAYVIFTSGSTGAPKGAALEHHSFLNFLRVRAVDCALEPGEELPQTAPVSFDISVWQMFAPLAAGACVCVVDEDTVRDPAAVSRLIVDHGHRYIELVPSFIAVLLDQWTVDPELGKAVRGTLRGLISTGEVLGVDLARRWNETVPEVELFNAYGPAECTDDVVQGSVITDPGTLYAPIGRPLPNARIYILDVDLQPLPPGVVGEIFIGGANVGRGYFREPALTASVFLPDPYAVRPGQRMYRTGDLGRWRPDGVLECLGRADTQVKLRGRRVELGEISHALEAHPEVSMAAVELIRDGGVERLVAFAAGTADDRPDGDALVAHLAASLPSYMVPHRVLVLDELPSNQNGKVDHRALSALAAAHDTRDEPYLAPRDELERELCATWEELLGVAEVGVRDDFYALGGDSIMGIRVVQEAKRRGITLRPRLVLELRTVEAVAAAVRVARAADETRTAVPGPPAAVPGGTGRRAREPYPLTAAQADFFRREVPQPDYWNSSVLFTLPVPVPTADIERSVRHLARRHQVLSARFERTAGGIGQRWVDEPPPVTVFELTGLAGQEADRETHRLATRLHTSLDLSRGPVCRVGVFRRDDGLDQLVVVAHHALLDQYSWDVLAEDLSALLADGGHDRLPPAGTSFFDWARRLADEVRRDPGRWNAGHWLEDTWTTDVTLCSGDLGTQGDLRVITTRMNAEWTSRFLDPRAHRIPVHDRLVAALGHAVQAWLGRPGGRLLLQLGGHGREDLFTDLDITGTVGYFSTAYPVQLSLPGTRDCTAYAELVTEHLSRIPDKGMAFGLLRHGHPDAEIRRRLDSLPAPQVVFDFLGETRFVNVGDSLGQLGFLRAPTSLNSGEARPADLPREAPLDVRVSVDDGQLTTVFLFSRTALDESGVQGLAGHWESALRSGHGEKETENTDR
ncbi:non-ribosomal peptide synthetase [Streptomyces clavuligerus]|uniref:Non-ribosomal peptide synthetase n=1 Tax=Streptomyces clavuligerus TaxID=1901 RepID=B5GS02_STRCL|nr:non-ribosomal peptide synthetase [Streptomyces clavuligerus]EDY49098.1 non-ribosomal peptide synthetase/polyketide synthase [Streptomyces clavuligerus]EFG03794.1 Non-ribosomal peptide synthetase [Streptomyces clavuligerus]MBY6307675.1 non-ribosomal peptide synthetase [Streptomyces clavuligerus]QCS09778.1 non-ribosomal peptide synthetase [Streptomyces clavuligerus]QPJ98180.1 non-ribosomal peptide synthetase [Streptomyces clavuligerus]